MIRKLLLFAIFVSPMGAQAFTFSIGGMQMSMFRLAIFLSLFLLLYQRHGKITLSRQSNKFSVRFMLLWVLYAACSFLWAQSIPNWFRNFFFLMIALISVILMTNVFDKESDIVSALKAYNWGIIVQSVIGWYEIFTRDYRFAKMTQDNLDYYVYGINRLPIAMAGNPNGFATMMFIGIFVAMICYRLCEKRKQKIIYFSCMINMIILLLISTSRANIIAALIALMIVLFSSGKKKILVIVAVLTLVIIFPETLSFIFGKIQFNVYAVSGSDYKRLNLVKNGLIFLGQTFGFGVGCGQIENWMQNRAVFYTGGTYSMHNWWVEILCGYGIPIFVGYLIFYIKLLRDNIISLARKTSSSKKIISTGIVAIMAGYTIGCLSSSSNFVNEHIWVFWAICISYQGLIFIKCEE